MLTQSQFQNLQKAHNDPVWFAENVVGIKLFDYQKNVLYSVRDNQKTAWRSGHGVGKTTTAAITVLWFITTRPGSKVITTASSWRQVSRILWSEIHKWRKKANWELIGNPPMTPLDLRISMSEEWFAVGEASDEPERLEGFHADKLLYVVDEGKSVPDATYESIEGALTTPGAKVLVISTPPPVMTGYFYDIFSKRRLGFTSFHTKSTDSPNVTEDWIQARKEEWGEDSPVYQTRVLGEFAESADDRLISLKWIEDAVTREIEPKGNIEVGLDVARFGDDRSVFVIRQGSKILDIVSHKKESTTETGGRLVELKRNYHFDIAKIDDIGVGGGVVDRGQELMEGIVGVNVGSKANDSEKFINKRAEYYWGLRLRFQQGDIDIPNNEELIGELADIKYSYNSRGQIQIEAKDQIKKRREKSPDFADATMLAFAYAEDADIGLNFF